MAEDVAFECLRRLQQALADPVRLQMVPHQFIRIEFRGVRRQEKQMGAALLRRRSRGVQEGLRAAWQELLDPAKAR